jgi:hypothetical protein
MGSGSFEIVLQVSVDGYFFYQIGSPFPLVKINYRRLAGMSRQNTRLRHSIDIHITIKIHAE